MKTNDSDLHVAFVPNIVTVCCITCARCMGIGLMMFGLMKLFQQTRPVQHQLHHSNLQNVMSFEMHFVTILTTKLNT